jgi:hypothetical protein
MVRPAANVNYYETSAVPQLTPRRINLLVDVPAKLDSRSISETCDLTSARLRFLLAQDLKARIHERVVARVTRRRETC